MKRAQEAAKAECNPYGDGSPKHRGPRCRELEAIEREKRDELASISADLATVRRAAELDKKVADAEAKLNPLGFWLVFGHCRNSQRERARDLVRTDTVAALPSPLADVKTPSDAIDRFFRECVRPALGKRVRASAMTAVWEQWCADRGGPSLSPTLFGRLAGERRRKERIGGHYWYMDVQLIAYGLQVAVDNTAASARLQAAQSAA